MSTTKTERPKDGARRKPEAPEQVTARGRSFRERQEAQGRIRAEFYVTAKERDAINALLGRLRT